MGPTRNTHTAWPLAKKNTSQTGCVDMRSAGRLGWNWEHFIKEDYFLFSRGWGRHSVSMSVSNRKWYWWQALGRLPEDRGPHPLETVHGGLLHQRFRFRLAVVHTFNPSTWEAEAGASLWVWGQPGLQELVPGQPGLDIETRSLVRQWWHMPLILALGRQRQSDLCEFKASLIYKVSFRTARAVTQRNPVSKNKECCF